MDMDSIQERFRIFVAFETSQHSVRLRINILQGEEWSAFVNISAIYKVFVSGGRSHCTKEL
jgi:hypothetical protein